MELRRAFETFTQTPFPPAESDDDEIAEIRADSQSTTATSPESSARWLVTGILSTR
jgi:hypothetical protein